MEGKPEDIPVMPSDQFLESLAIPALRLFNEELFVVGVLHALSGPL
jgi:hypothetical protein